MTAREMFEELGYCEEKGNEYIEYIKFFSKIKRNGTILFDLENKTISATIDNNLTNVYVFDIDINELKAINQQIKELGWND